MREKGEEGQAIVLVALAMGIFLLGAVGLAVDGSHLYSQRQMAQAAADSAAIAGIMSIFHGTNTSGTAAFSTGSSFTCTTTDAKTPCVYAAKNGFGTTCKRYGYDRLPNISPRCGSLGLICSKSRPCHRATQSGYNPDADVEPDVFYHRDSNGDGGHRRRLCANSDYRAAPNAR